MSPPFTLANEWHSVKLAPDQDGYRKEWPCVEYTDDYPGFYMDLLQNGDEPAKQLAGTKLVQQMNNQGLMNKLKAWNDGMALGIIAVYQKQLVAENKVDRSLGNLLMGLGHPDYKPKGDHEQWRFNNLGNGGGYTMEQMSMEYTKWEMAGGVEAPPPPPHVPRSLA